MVLSATPSAHEEPSDSADHKTVVLSQLAAKATARGWQLVHNTIPVAVRRSSGAVEADWEMLAVKVKDGTLWCRVWQFRDGQASTKDLSAGELGLNARDAASLQHELRESPTSLTGGNTLRSISSTGESIQAYTLAFRRGVQTLSDETLREAQVSADKALQLVETMFDEAAKMRALIGLGANDSRLAPWKRELLSGTPPEDVQQLAVQAREIYAELARRAAERLHTFQARQQKLDAMLKGL